MIWIEILVLKKVEQRFAPLHITSLFDVIMGTSASGIIAMGLLAKIPLPRMENFMEEMAQDILNKGVGMSKAIYLAMNGPLCDSKAFDRALQRLFKTVLSINIVPINHPTSSAHILFPGWTLRELVVTTPQILSTHPCRPFRLLTRIWVDQFGAWPMHLLQHPCSSLRDQSP